MAHQPASVEFDPKQVNGKVVARVSLFAFALLAAASLLAQLGAPPGSQTQSRTRPVRLVRPQKQGVESLRSFLELDERQLQALNELSQHHKVATQPISARICANQEHLHQAMASGSESDAGQSGRLVAESQRLKAQLDSARHDLVVKATAVLSAEQQSRLAALAAIVEAQRAAAPGLMPEAWPMLRAAAELGLVGPASHAEGEAEAEFGESAATPAPGQQ
jgi:hypothetical protein